jgi:hypothetical protein
MTDESADTEPKSAVSSSNAEPDEGRPEARSGSTSENHGATYNFNGPVLSSVMFGQATILAAVAIYSKAFVEALAKRHADAVSDLVRKRFRPNDATGEYWIGLDSAATIVVNEDLPDEARLALLDLDVTADELRGKLLRWDDSASAWRPDPD